jgi:hypothetical protein
MPRHYLLECCGRSSVIANIKRCTLGFKATGAQVLSSGIKSFGVPAIEYDRCAMFR